MFPAQLLRNGKLVQWIGLDSAWLWTFGGVLPS